MKETNRVVKLNLSINQTYFSLFKEQESLKFLANMFLKDYPNQTNPTIAHGEIPEWKEELLESLHSLLKTEDEGRLFGNQLIVNFSEGYALEETQTAKNFVSMTFSLKQEAEHDEQGS
ncbi:hypothetical protein [Vibrio phage phiKT1019]|nr:hypothetical protein [Vibrio phage phiKT1019]